MGRAGLSNYFISNEKIAVLGAGSWGMTLAILLAERHNVKIWEFDKEQCEKLNKDRENKKFLPGIKIPDSIFISNNIEEVISDSNIVFFAVPSHIVRSLAARVKDLIKDKIIVNVAKGIDTDTLERLSEVIRKESNTDKVVVLSGPSHAEEVSRKIPTTVVISAIKESNIDLEYLQKVIMTDRFRVYTNDDIIGVELGGALKNIIAIASGISDGLGYGSNTKAALMTRGLAEIERLGIKLGAKRETFAGLTGMGDLITTCISKFSRNRFVGEELGKGKKLKEILNNMIMVAEGVKTTLAAYKLSRKYEVVMPITEEVYKILYEDKDAKESVTTLMLRSPKPELWL